MAVLWCVVRDTRESGDHILFTGEVKAHDVDPRRSMRCCVFVAATRTSATSRAKNRRGISNVSQVKAAPSPTREAENRALVALACRVMAAAGLFDMHGHISLRDGDVAYINGRRSSRISVTAAQVAIVKIADGSVVSGEPPAETALHLGCYRARPRSVASPISIARRDRVRDSGEAAHHRVQRRRAVRTGGARVRRSRSRSQRLAGERDGQGPRRASRGAASGHGVAVVADDIPSCVTLSLYLEENAKRLAYAMTIGDPQPYTDDEIKRVAASLWQPFVIEKTWIDAQERARRAGALDDLA